MWSLEKIQGKGKYKGKAVKNIDDIERKADGERAAKATFED